MPTTPNNRSQLRIADLKQRVPSGSRLMNVKIPAHLVDAVGRLAKQLGTTKTDVVIALLNAGLEEAAKVRSGPRRKRH